MASDDDLEYLMGVDQHAGDKWLERRSCNPGYGPVIAWNEAVWLPPDNDLRCDEARYHPETDTILVVNSPMNDDHPRVLSTVIDASTGNSAALESAIEVAREQAGVDPEDVGGGGR